MPDKEVVILMQVNEKIAKIQFDGGTLCLDFANTVHHRKKDPMPDYLHHILDLIAWAKQIQLIDSGSHDLLSRKVIDCYPITTKINSALSCTAKN